MIAPDSSVAIGAAAPWHVAQDAAVAAMAPEKPSLIGHVAFETTAALSRMPEGQRLAPEVVLDWLERRFSPPWLTLPADAVGHTLRAAVQAGIRGGPLYDALIADRAQPRRARRRPRPRARAAIVVIQPDRIRIRALPLIP